jgi:hypothetical protein
MSLKKELNNLEVIFLTMILMNMFHSNHKNRKCKILNQLSLHYIIINFNKNNNNNNNNNNNHY